MSNVKVVCRFRPPNALELKEAGNEPIVIINDEGNSVKLKSQEGMKGPDAAGFTFDRVFPMDTKQVEVFEYGVKGIVEGLSALATPITSYFNMIHISFERN
jgi:kinesin family protein 5